MVIASYPNYVHLSAGDLLREESKKDTDNAKIIQEVFKAGKLVPTRITCSLLRDAILTISHKKKEGIKFLIDGYPRNKENMDGWNDVIGDKITVNHALYLDCSKDILKERLLKRKRKDDVPEIIEKRFATFEKEELPVILGLESRGILRKLDASKSPKEVYENAKKFF